MEDKNIFLFFLLYTCNFLRVRVLRFCLDGLITTSSTTNINYESLATSTVVVNVHVSDGTASATSSLTISIMDVNEAPVFGKTLYQITGTEGNVRKYISL